MLSRGPKARLSLNILVFFILGWDWCHTHPATWTIENEGGQGEMAEGRFLSSDEEPGILLPPDDKYNFVGEDDPTGTESVWRTGKSSPFPPSTIVSTNSYSIRPESGSQYKINTKPLPIVTTAGSSYTVKTDMGSYNSYSPKNSDKSTVFVKNNCFGPRCPEQSNRDQYEDDDSKSYHYILNKGVKFNKRQRKYNADRPSQSRRFEEDLDGTSTHKMSLSIPFVVDPSVSKYDTSYPNNNQLSKRVLRTTTPSSSSSTTPGWIKLQPILPDQYDPFTLRNNKTKKASRPSHSVNPSQFANRLGVELDPQSFADRWGWGDQNNNEQGSGSRFPAWLQDASNVNVGTNDRDADSRNWVKLEPIPVAGVTISKWVPKGTPNSDLPSTNWPTRDRVHSNGNGLGHSNPNQNPVDNPSSTKWWDIIDNINRFQQSRPPSSYDAPPRGWNQNKNQGQPTSSWDRTPQNPWGDVIYPNGPSSATVSWQQDKDMSKYSSSFPNSLASSPPWQSDLRRPSSAVTGSWSADRKGQYPDTSYGGNRRQGTASYPDRNFNEDDPRWVLVSNSRKVTVSPNNDQHRPPNGYENKFKPPFDKFSDFPFYESPYKNRRGKNYKDLIKITNITVSRPSWDQDAAFSKINATLANLTPVLSHNRKTRNNLDITGTSESSNATSTVDLSSVTSSATKKPSRMPAFLKPYFGSGRKMGEAAAATNAQAFVLPASNGNNNRGRRGLNINPVYAAVGAGMIPATMAAVLPMVLGRKRRDVTLQNPLGTHLNWKSNLMDNEYNQNLLQTDISDRSKIKNGAPKESSLQLLTSAVFLPNKKHLKDRIR